MTTATRKPTMPVKVDATELDTCPKHDAPVTKEYDFGMEDATVIKFACGCAACVDRSDGFGDRAALYPSYDGAAGMARLIVAGENAFAHKYGF